jgi:hypothetical protein
VQRHLGALAEIDQLSVDSVAQRAPLVFHDERPAIQTEALIHRMQFVQLGHGGLN